MSAGTTRGGSVVIVGTGVVGGPGRPGGFIGLDLNPHLRLVEGNPGARLYEVLPVPADHPPLLPPPGIPPVHPARAAPEHRLTGRRRGRRRAGD